ncbi:MAG: hypothetical protein QOJ19_3184, partial [Acidimicrobiia bacterium]|nr:hypothetical protein [Acidimicrobiia bacterium]
MSGLRTSRLVTGLVALALVAAACGSSGSKQEADTTTVPSAGSSTASTAAQGSTSSTTAGPQPASLAEWEALWTKERAAIVKRIKD